jgi:hypothetical protein
VFVRRGPFVVVRLHPARSGYYVVRAEVVAEVWGPRAGRSCPAGCPPRASRGLTRERAGSRRPTPRPAPTRRPAAVPRRPPGPPAVSARGLPPLQQEARSSCTSVRSGEDPAVARGGRHRGGGAESHPFGHGQPGAPLAPHASRRSRRAHQHRTDSHTCSTQAATGGREGSCGSLYSRALLRRGKSGPGLRHVSAHARGGRGQRLASLGIPVVLTLDGLVDRLVVVRHVLRIGTAPWLLKDVQTSTRWCRAMISPRRGVPSTITTTSPARPPTPARGA